MADRDLLLAGDRFDQIPSVAITIFEHTHDAIWFMARCFNEADTPLRVSEVVTGEVVRYEKQEHLIAALIEPHKITDGAFIYVAVGDDGNPHPMDTDSRITAHPASRAQGFQWQWLST